MSFRLTIRPPPRAFTLVEVLIVVVIVGILAATVLPGVLGLKREAGEMALKQNLFQVRHAILRYSLSHGGQLPGQVTDGTYPPSDEQCFVRQLSSWTTSKGLVVSGPDVDGALSPVLTYRLPICTVGLMSGRSRVLIVNVNGKITADPDGTHAWKYNRFDGTFLCNSKELTEAENESYDMW